MTQLTADGLARARAFVDQHARPIDRALLAFYLDAGPAEGVTDALARYANDDGGFGRCLEPDFRLDASSPMATSVGLQYLREVGARAEHPLVARATDYLVATYDDAIRGWPQMPPAINDVPRAPWWTWSEEGAATAAREHWPNPSAELLGALVRWRPTGARALIDAALTRLDEVCDDDTQLEGHDLLCLNVLLRDVQDPIRARVAQRLAGSAATVDAEPDAWAGYGLQPWWAIDGPDHPLAGPLGDALDANLDWMLTQQGDDGAWSPAWSWEPADAWAEARREWQGALTVKLLHRLHQFDRLPG